MKKKILLGTLLLMLMLSVYSFVEASYLENKENRQCGTVIEIQNQPYQSKSVTYYNQYLLINFDSVGLEAIKVDMTTFMSQKKGDRVCFMLNERQMHSPDCAKHELIAVIGLCLTVLLFFIIIGVYFE